MLLDIIIYPDKRLKLISKNITNFDKKLHMLLDNMYETMIHNNGVGLAAIQVGVQLRALIINLPVEIENSDKIEQIKENNLEIINPIFIKKTGSTKSYEGCLSIPTINEEIDRFEYVKIKYQNRFGDEHLIENHSFLAIAIQHEIDHLDGKVFIEKLSFLKRKKFDKVWKKTWI